MGAGTKGGKRNSRSWRDEVFYVQLIKSINISEGSYSSRDDQRAPLRTENTSKESDEDDTGDSRSELYVESFTINI